MMNSILLTVILLFYVAHVQPHLIINLSGGNWSLHNSNRSILVAGNVPGGVYSDLREGGVLKEDLFYRFNDEDYRWVSYENWIYTTEFIYEGTEHNPDERIKLVFKGVDTVAEIFLNNHYIGSTNNMFVRYRFVLGNDILQDGVNKLEVRLASPVVWAAEQAKEMPHVIPTECWPDTYNGECHVNLIRKMQASFAWDWGPAFPSMGIWKDVYLEKCWGPVLTDIGIAVNDDGDNYNVDVKAWFDRCKKKSGPVHGILSARLHLNNKTAESKLQITLIKVLSFLQGEIRISVPKEDAELWWPNGYGSQPLYDIEVAFATDNDLQIKVTSMAFRIVELIELPLPNDEDEKGLGFFFAVNDVSIYAKGSNWIPSDILPERSANKSRIRHLLKSAASANFNMLRVWGGGVYESNFFYKMCDKLGIMVWQDLMFACNMYPATRDFIMTASVEVAQQVKRLQQHPSIVVWAGNNENEVALAQNWYGTQANFSLFKNEYIELYVKHIKPIVMLIDTSRVFLESSPSNGVESIKEGYISSNPQSTYYGDVHYYNYASNLWESSAYPRTRFTSEYGVQSLPSINTLKEVALPSDLEMYSEWIQHRQHQENGFVYLITQISYNLPTPKNLKQFIYYSQINQAMSIQTESEHYRSMRSTLFPTGEGYNMGALYWQLNDVWQAPTWSSIDYSGRWKMLHYYAVKFFAPVIITATLSPYDWILVYAVSDRREDIENVKLTMSLMSSKHFIPIKSSKSIIDIKAKTGAEVLSGALYVLNKDCGNKAECFFKFTLKDELGHDIASPSYLFPVRIKHMDLTQPNIIITKCERQSSRKFYIQLKTDAIAFFVWLEVADVIGMFSDNGFHMDHPTIDLFFKGINNIDLDDDEFCKSISIINVKSVL